MTTPSGPGERAFSRLLALYPRDFREPYAHDLMEVFRLRRDQRLETRRRLGFGFWRFIVLDVAASAWREHWDSLDSHTKKGDGVMGWMDDLFTEQRGDED